MLIMGCVQVKETRNLDEVIGLYESKLAVLNAEIVKLKSENLMITSQYTLRLAKESADDVFVTNHFVF